MDTEDCGYEQTKLLIQTPISSIRENNNKNRHVHSNENSFTTVLNSNLVLLIIHLIIVSSVSMEKVRMSYFYIP